MMTGKILKYIGFTLFAISIVFLAIGAWVLILLILNNFKMGAHGVPHAISILGLFWGSLLLILARKLIRFSRSNPEENSHA